jgi:hypothetical protein
MKRFILSWLTVAVCLVLCVGCAYLKPSQEQRTAADARPWGGAGSKAEEHLAADLVSTAVGFAK